jgi:hypothetical protein
MKGAEERYKRAKAILDMVEGVSAEEQSEIDANKAAVLLNLAAVHLATEVLEAHVACIVHQVHGSALCYFPGFA